MAERQQRWNQLKRLVKRLERFKMAAACAAWKSAVGTRTREGIVERQKAADNAWADRELSEQLGLTVGPVAAAGLPPGVGPPASDVLRQLSEARRDAEEAHSRAHTLHAKLERMAEQLVSGSSPGGLQVSNNVVLI